MGSVEQPSLPSTKYKNSNKIQIKELPGQVSKDDLTSVLLAYGSVLNIDIGNNNQENEAIVTFENSDQAQKALEELRDHGYQGLSVKVEFLNSNGGRSQNKFRLRSLSSSAGNSHVVNLPLRILVPSEFIGAIIGKKGQSIKTITTRCKARVDVHGKENTDLVEKIISIYGQPENCTKACKEILQVMEHEAVANLRGDVTLKMLTNDKFCGRLIGKEGKMIKKIREDTGTKIVVTNAQEMSGLYLDRVILIRGNIDNLSEAEAAISSKLVECMQQDLRSPTLSSDMMNVSMAMLQSGLGSYCPFSTPYHGMNTNLVSSSAYNNTNYNNNSNNVSFLQPNVEVCQIVLPNSAVGAIIGTSGSNIKQMMRDSCAFMTVEHKTDGNLNASSERFLTIKGTVDSCWRANYFVFEKMKLEGFSGNDDVRLKTTINVPRMTVGRIIGKAGKNVREIQRLTGAIVALPQNDQTTMTMMMESVPVEVFGNFMATQSAHSRIRTIVNQTLHQSSYSSSFYAGGHHLKGVIEPGPVEYQVYQQ